MADALDEVVYIAPDTGRSTPLGALSLPASIVTHQTRVYAATHDGTLPEVRPVARPVARVEATRRRPPPAG